MHGEDRPNIKTQHIIGALKLAEFPDHISIDYVHISSKITLSTCIASKVELKQRLLLLQERQRLVSTTANSFRFSYFFAIRWEDLLHQ